MVIFMVISFLLYFFFLIYFCLLCKEIFNRRQWNVVDDFFLGGITLSKFIKRIWRLSYLQHRVTLLNNKILNQFLLHCLTFNYFCLMYCQKQIILVICSFSLNTNLISRCQLGPKLACTIQSLGLFVGA